MNVMTINVNPREMVKKSFLGLDVIGLLVHWLRHVRLSVKNIVVLLATG